MGAVLLECVCMYYCIYLGSLQNILPYLALPFLSEGSPSYLILVI